MTDMEILANLIAFGALVVAIISLYKTSRNAAQNTRLSNGNLEIQLREMISSSRRFLSSCIHNMAVAKINPDMEKNEELQKKVGQLVDDAFQDYVNSYEEACMKYIDNKVDKNRFKKTYKVEITNLVSKYEDMFGPASVYTATRTTPLLGTTSISN